MQPDINIHLVMSLPATYVLWRYIGSAWAERAGQREVGGCTWRVQTAWLCLGFTLLVGTGQAVLLLLCL